MGKRTCSGSDCAEEWQAEVAWKMKACILRVQDVQLAGSVHATGEKGSHASHAVEFKKWRQVMIAK